MPDKNVLPAAQSPFAQRARQPAPVQQPRVAPGQPQATPRPVVAPRPAGGGGASQQSLEAYGVNFDEWTNKIKTVSKRADLEGMIRELIGIRSRIEAQENPTVNQGAPVSRAPTAAAPSPFARQSTPQPTPAGQKGGI